MQRMYWHLPRTFSLIKPNQKNDFLLCARSLDLPCGLGQGPHLGNPTVSTPSAQAELMLVCPFGCAPCRSTTFARGTLTAAWRCRSWLRLGTSLSWSSVATRWHRAARPREHQAPASPGCSEVSAWSRHPRGHPGRS